MKLTSVKETIAAYGLAYRGGHHTSATDFLAEDHIRTLVLIGVIGRKHWPSFTASSEAADGMPDPLDRWSRRILSVIAVTLGATAIFPFDGPPWVPFQLWAKQAEPVHPSPLGVLIHPDWGLWHSWRGALGFRQHIDLPEPDRRPSPCESCADKPCLTACPVGAFASGQYDVAACVAHIDALKGVAWNRAAAHAARVP